MPSATSDDAFTQAWFDYCRNVFPQSEKKTGTKVDFYKVSTHQCSIIFNNLDSFSQKSEFQRIENKDKPVIAGEKINVTDNPQLSLLREFW